MDDGEGCRDAPVRLYPVVLCGGGGARLWPLSRPDRPKPFVAFGGPRSLLHQAVERVAPLGPARVVAGIDHEVLVVETLAEAGAGARLILEPAPRDTAAAIAAAALEVLAEDADGVMIVAPADHYIPAGDRFREAAFAAATRSAEGGAICLMGLRPREASSAFGYILPGQGSAGEVARFVEKPEPAEAARLIEDGALWNIGVFVGPAGVFVEALARHAPEVLAAARAAVERGERRADALKLDAAFATAPALPFDRAVMERTDRARVMPVDFSWRDLGAWDAVAELEATDTRHRLVDSPGAYVRAPEGVDVAVIGAPDVAVVVEGNRVLACRLDQAQRVRDVAEALGPASVASATAGRHGGGSDAFAQTMRPRTDLTPHTRLHETEPFIRPEGFRDYDARWRLGEEINLTGMQAVGLGLATLLKARGRERRIIVGHDFRSYSFAVKQALTLGLISGGMEVVDIGLCLTPTAYFAREALDCGNVAMVTASHNENGWTGIKMGDQTPFTFGPDDMAELAALVMAARGRPEWGGSARTITGMPEQHVEAVVGARRLTRPLKVVVGCGNGTAGAFVPEALARLGAEVIPLHADLDPTFPNHNPNPEDGDMLAALGEAVQASGADLGLAFDGDGDRCGVVDETGAPVLSDRIGLLLAREMAARSPGATFVVDVKCTGLFRTDPVLTAHGARVLTGRTGHSHIKRTLAETSALAGFEKSGHIYFGGPDGGGYDDALRAAVAVLELMGARPAAPLSVMAAELGRAWTSLTLSPRCPDGSKHAVVARARRAYANLAASGGSILGRTIRRLETIDGVRVELDDGSWLLVRASSNKPELAVVVESLRSEADMRDLFRLEARPRLAAEPEVGDYNQEI